MKLAIIVDSLHSIAAGSERQIYQLVKGLSDRGEIVTLYVLRHTEFTRQLASFPCRIECADVTSLASLKGFRQLRLLKKKLRNDRVDIVHAYFPDSCVIAPLFLRDSSWKVVSSRRDMGLIYRDMPLILFKLLRSRSDYVVSNSDTVAQHVQRKEKVHSEKLRVIYNGLDDYKVPEMPAAASPFSCTESLKLILVANIKPVKRTLDLIYAVSRLSKSGIKVECALIGQRQDKEYSAQADALVRQLQLEKAVHFLGQVDEPRSLLGYADIGLLCSESEGLSNALMEYMQLGLPVIASRVGGNPELVIENKTGLLYAAGNVAELCDALQRLAGSQELQINLGAAARYRIQNSFSLDAMIDAHIQLYNEAIAS